MLITDHLLLNYKRCNRRTYLEMYGDPQQKDPEKDFVIKLKRENQTHIAKVIAERSFALLFFACQFSSRLAAELPANYRVNESRSRLHLSRNFKFRL